jgi:Skp family chaperone for outer membrane proteins
MKTTIVRLILALTAAVSIAHAQSPAPIIVQAIVPGQKTVTASAAPAAIADETQATLKFLQELKAANEEFLKKQSATLQQLDEIEKSAEQIRIYSKRG